MSNINKTSGFWIGSDIRDRYYDPLTGLSTAPKGKDIFKLHGYQKAISNFVRIVTSQNIPVRFSTKDDSYTNGKEITLSGNIQDGNFDVAVGLALHEGSHIKLTDFTSMERVVNQLTDKLVAEALTKGITKSQLINTVRALLNVVEDRRIDKFIQTEAPGYRGYYDAMYNKYFNAKIITTALQNREWNEESLEHYMNHIINFINAERTLDLLVGLKDVWNIMGLGNIQRLKTTQDAMDVAVEMLETIINVLPVPPKDEQDKGEGEGESDDNTDKQEGESGDGDGNGSGDGDSGDEDGVKDFDPNAEKKQGNSSGGASETADDGPSGDPSDDGSSASGETSKDKGGKTQELTPKQKAQLEKALAQQKDFINGDTKKTNVKKDEAQKIDAIDKADAKLETVDNKDHSGYGKQQEEVLVVNKLNDEALESVIPQFRVSSYSSSQYDSVVPDGIRLGRMLGKKLQLRNDDLTTTYNRQKKGRVDRRLLADLGVGSTNIFDQTFVTTAKEASIHISIDASGSMGGTRWKQALTTATAIATACDMVGDIDVRIDMRAFTRCSLTKSDSGSPVVAIIYDSKVNGLSHIRKYFTKIGPTGGTPEGICFKAIEKIITQGGDKDKYFINFSDGEPNQQYINITTSSVKNIKKAGVHVLSYFMNEGKGYGASRANDTFKAMYKDSASFIDTKNLMQVAKTMNKLLSKKS